MRIKALLIISLYISIILICCNSEKYPAGKRVYTIYCENCHMEDGSGLPPLYPDITKSNYLGTRITELPCLIRKGQKGKIIETVNMPAINLGVVDLANLINYMTYRWAGDGKINFQEIEAAIERCP